MDQSAVVYQSPWDSPNRKRPHSWMYAEDCGYSEGRHHENPRVPHYGVNPYSCGVETNARGLKNNNSPKHANRNSSPLHSNHNSSPLHSNHNSSPLHSNHNSSPLHSNRNSSPLHSNSPKHSNRHSSPLHSNKTSPKHIGLDPHARPQAPPENSSMNNNNGYVCDPPAARPWYPLESTHGNVYHGNMYHGNTYHGNTPHSARLSPNNNDGVAMDWSPEKASSSGSSFDSGYTSALNNNAQSPPDAHYTGAPYQLSQRPDSYPTGIRRTLDKCEDRCVREVHPSQVWAEHRTDWESIIKVKYIGSFSVIGEDQNARAEYVRKQLMEMRNVTKTKPVLLVISLSGVKVCSSTGESVYMAHALKRISYATCDPDFCQFSFLAREPKGHTNIQYCHGFITATPREAEELNAIVGNAFKMAFTHQRESQQQSDPAPATLTATPAATTTATPPTETSPPPLHRQPTFHEMIEQQISVQKEQSEQQTRRREQELTKRLSEISTAKVDERMREISERRRKDKEDADREAEIQRQQRLQGKDRTTWAKHVAGRTKHKSPLRVTTTNTVAMGDPQSKLSSSPHHGNGSRPGSAGGPGSPPPGSGSPQFIHPIGGSNLVPLPFSSLTALRDAFNAGELRTYGSPVMTLKETIDRIQWTETPPPGGDSVDGGAATQLPGEAESAPASPEVLPSYIQSSTTDFSQRPLPATPPEIFRRSRPKGQKSTPTTQRSPPSYQDEGQSSRPQSTTNGHASQVTVGRSRPLSGRFQNDSPLHSQSIDLEDGAEGPPTPLRYDSLRQIDRSDAPIEEDLKNAQWYQAGIPREIALEMLTQEEIGSFVVRDSTTHPGCYALSVKVPKFDNPSGISHYLIMRTSHGGVKLKGLEKEWTSLTALVTHHSVMRELLPCPLRLPRAAQNPAFHADDDRHGDQEEDEDYQRLADCSHMMDHLKM